MLRSDKNVSPRASIILKDINSNDVVVMNLNANINVEYKSMMISYDTVNKDMVNANISAVQADIDSFKATVRTEAETNGLVCFF
jgi:hypothetical protein